MPSTVVEDGRHVPSHEIELAGLDPCADCAFEVTPTSPDRCPITDDGGGAYPAVTATAGTPVVVDATDTRVSLPDHDPPADQRPTSSGS